MNVPLPSAPSHGGPLRGEAPRRPPDWVLDLIAVALVLLTGLFPVPRMPFPDPAVLVLLPVTAVVAALALLLRRRLPVTALALTLLCYGVTVLMHVPMLGPGIAAVIAAYSMAGRVPRIAALLGGGLAAVVIALLSLRTVPDLSVDPRVFQVAAALAVAVALGDSARSRREYLAAVTERAERAERSREVEARRRVAEERLRIARDLHDTVAHRISVISLNAGVASQALESRPEKAREALGTIRSAARGVLSEISDLLTHLRSEEDSAAPTRPQWGMGDLPELVARMEAAGLEIDLRVDGELERVDGTAGQVGYLVVQEGLTNAHKHGRRHGVRVRIAVGSSSLRIEVLNRIEPLSSGRGEVTGDQLGLLGVRERVASAGGTVEAGLAGMDFRLLVELPLTERSRG